MQRSHFYSYPFDLCWFSADFVVCVNIVPEYSEPYLASNSEVSSKSYSKSKKEVHIEQQDKRRIRKPADFTCLPCLRSQSGKDQFRFSN